MKERLAFHPVTPDRWPDLDRLFSASRSTQEGEPAVCWCMEWRRPRAEWEAGRGEGNRRAMQAFIEGGQVPGLLAYAGDEVVAWCSVAPRPQLVGLREIGRFRRFENPDIWTVSCFYIRDDFRGQGLMAKLLAAGIEYAKANGARVIEGYPADEATDDSSYGSFVSVYWGRASVFRELGFVEVARAPRDNRPVMRYYVTGRP